MSLRGNWPFGRDQVSYLSRRLGNLANALDTYTVGTQRHTAICGKVAVGDKNSKAISAAAGVKSSPGCTAAAAFKSVR